MGSDTYVIIGAGLAGVSAAEELRTLGVDDRVVVVDRQTELPYDHPPLSTAYLLGGATRDEVFLHDRVRFADTSIPLGDVGA